MIEFKFVYNAGMSVVANIVNMVGRLERGAPNAGIRRSRDREGGASSWAAVAARISVRWWWSLVTETESAHSADGQGKRILPYIRLSLVTDNTTSPERQYAKIAEYATFGGHDIVEVTEADYDLDVSGAVSPFDRPALSRWLAEDRLGEWDIICVAKLDRISRSLFDFTSLLHWLEAHGKSLIILDPMLDLTTKEGRAMANVLMTFAEYEREVIGARVKDAYDKLRQSGKYTGGIVPFGYRPVKLGKGWGYEPDPEYAPVVREMAERFLADESPRCIARWLNETGVPSPKDVIRKRHGKKAPTGTPWGRTTITAILSSPTIIGAATTARKQELIRDKHGMVVYRADPLVDRDTYERLQARFFRDATHPARVSTSPLLRVVFCAVCGAAAHISTSHWKPRATRHLPDPVVYNYRYYKCSRANDGAYDCPARQVNADLLEESVFATLLELAGWQRLTEKRLIPGRDFSEESAWLIEQTQRLQAEISRARLARRDYSDLQTQLDSAGSELDRLAALDPEPARIEYTPTGLTFRQWWEAHDLTARREFLAAQGVKVYVHRTEMPAIDDASRPPGQRTMAIIDKPGLKAVVYLGNLGELLRRSGELTVMPLAEGRLDSVA